MAWTYSGNPTSSDLDAVRFYVGDTDQNDQLLQDAEINFLLSESPRPIAAAARAAQVICSKMSRLVDEKFETIDNKLSQRATAFQMLAIKLEKQALKTVGMGPPSAGGLLVTEVEEAQRQENRVKPTFKRDQFATYSFGNDGTN